MFHFGGKSEQTPYNGVKSGIIVSYGHSAHIFLEERKEIIDIVFKERSAPVSRFKCGEVNVPPAAVRRHCDIAPLRIQGVLRFGNRHSEVKYSPCIGNRGTVNRFEAFVKPHSVMNYYPAV